MKKILMIVALCYIYIISCDRDNEVEILNETRNEVTSDEIMKEASRMLGKILTKSSYYTKEYYK